MTKLYARDLPSNGSPKRCTINGVEFEVRRMPRPYDRRKFTYTARQLPALNDFSGWWYRYDWASMEKDLQLMAQGEYPE